MKIENLIKMANDIGDFFNAEEDKEIASDGVKTHIQRIWEPRMRKQLLIYFEKDGSDLSDLVKKALSKLE
ncbi:MAG: formate dehydrogenase subunit delta [Methylococcaceae bacterium]